MPGLGLLVCREFHIVGPARDRAQRSMLKQPVDRIARRWLHFALGDFTDNRMPFLPPGEGLPGQPTHQCGRESDQFHKL